MIKINDFEIQQRSFPDGSWLLNNIPYTFERFNYTIELDWRYDGEHELSLLIFLAKYLKDNYPKTSLILKMYYVPNARMDRTYNKSEVFTLKYFCDIINSLNFDNIIVMDVHSNVTTALLNKYNERPLIELNKLIRQYNNIYFPDEGAQKRYSKLLDLSGKYIYTGMKKRNWGTGAIEGLEIFTTLETPNKESILMIDDICSYGGTFFFSADKLKKAGFNSIDAYCTHSEKVVNNPDSKIQLAFRNGLINKLYTTNTLLQNTESEHIIIYHV